MRKILELEDLLEITIKEQEEPNALIDKKLLMKRNFNAFLLI